MFAGVQVEAVQDGPQARHLRWDQEAEPGARKSSFFSFSIWKTFFRTYSFSNSFYLNYIFIFYSV